MLWYNVGPVPTTYPSPTGLSVLRCQYSQLSHHPLATLACPRAVGETCPCLANCPCLQMGPRCLKLTSWYPARATSSRPHARWFAVVNDASHAVMAYFDLLSYLYLSRLIHDASLIIPKLSVPPDHLYHSYICTCTHVNAYRTYPLSRYSATILLNAHTRVSATYLPILYGHSHAHSPFLVDSFRVIPSAIFLTHEAIPYCGLQSHLHMIVYLTAH